MRLHLNPEGSLFMAFGPRESMGRKVEVARERKGGYLGGGAEGRWASWGLRGARASAEEMHSKREIMARRCKVVLSDEWIRLRGGRVVGAWGSECGYRSGHWSGVALLSRRVEVPEQRENLHRRQVT